MLDDGPKFRRRRLPLLRFQVGLNTLNKGETVTDNEQTQLTVEIHRAEECVEAVLSPAARPEAPKESRKLLRILGVGFGIAVTIGSTVGLGILRAPGTIAGQIGIPWLEDWFDPNRLKDDYVPTGFKGHGVKSRAVKGHEFGLQLSAGDKQALIAFLKTL